MALVTMAMRNAPRKDAVATIGKQAFWPSRRFLTEALRTAGVAHDADSVFAAVGPSRNGSAFLKLLGARHVDEVDASDYEGASIVHDMNVPLPEPYRHRYDVVYDGGSMEHIFDVRQVMENIGDMLKPGGLYVGTTCANNMLGHGFYQFSPEFFYRLLCPENGWESTAVFLCEHNLDPPGFWFVADPMKLGTRIQIQTSSQLNILVVSVKTSHPPAFQVPQQSDYMVAWSGITSADSGETNRPSSHIARVAKRILRMAGLNRLRDFLPRRRRYRGLRQPGMVSLTTQEFLMFSIRRQADDRFVSALKSSHAPA